jgi:hypothetical protein
MQNLSIQSLAFQSLIAFSGAASSAAGTAAAHGIRRLRKKNRRAKTVETLTND